MKSNSTVTVAALIAVSLAGCGGPRSGKGFTLPDGDAMRGQAVFAELKCAACHQVDGVDRPAPTDGSEHELSVPIGGMVSRIQTYGELVTSIINPSHKLAPGNYGVDVADESGTSRMSSYNDVMTVQQLIDLVAFLQSKYELIPYEPSDYPTYYP